MSVTARAAGLLARTFAAKHRRAAATLDRVADRQMDTAILWRETGEPVRAIHAVREAILHRQLAQLERERAQLEEHREEHGARTGRRR
jgi:hypothetical protein